MKQLILIYLFVLASGCALMGQSDSVRVITEWQMGKLAKIRPTGPAKLKKQRPLKVIEHPAQPHWEYHEPGSLPETWHDDGLAGHSAKAQGKNLSVGTQFEANHLFGSIPADPAAAISNDGRIVSIDNASIAYFKDNRDTIVKYGLPHDQWYQDSTLVGSIFDPKVIYDSYTDRFITVLLYVSDDFTDSRVLISFSQPHGPDSLSWNHYQIHCDSIYTEGGEAMFWVDFPNIAINKNELFITLNIFDHDSTTSTNSKEKTLLLQIGKSGGYAGAANLVCKEWRDVQNTDGNSQGIYVPLGDAFQSPTFGPGCYMVSNYSQNSTKFFWYELTGDINDAGATIIAHLTSTSFFYSYPSFASQMGSNGSDRIKFSDCRIHSGFYQAGKLHFVFHRGDNGWGEIVYAKITIANNSFQAHSWGGDEDSLNSFYPSIAPFGRDSSEENSIITFSRSGPTIFPQVCAIQFDTSWSPSVTVVKQGLGLIDQRADLVAPWDSLERIGDYSDIQRRYNDPSNACWLIGSYAAGPAPNHFGVVDGIKCWIAEIGDSTIVSVPEPSLKESYQFFPNPIKNGNMELHFRLGSERDFGSVVVSNLTGKQFLYTNYRGPSFSIQVPDLSPGIYFIKLNSNKNKKYATQKLLVYP